MNRSFVSLSLLMRSLREPSRVLRVHARARGSVLQVVTPHAYYAFMQGHVGPCCKCARPRMQRCGALRAVQACMHACVYKR